MAAIVLKALYEVMKHVLYHLLGALFERKVEEALQKKRRKRKKARTKELVKANHTECHTIQPRDDPSLEAMETCILFILIDDDTHPHY